MNRTLGELRRMAQGAADAATMIGALILIAALLSRRSPLPEIVSGLHNALASPLTGEPDPMLREPTTEELAAHALPDWLGGPKS